MNPSSLSNVPSGIGLSCGNNIYTLNSLFKLIRILKYFMFFLVSFANLFANLVDNPAANIFENGIHLVNPAKCSICGLVWAGTHMIVTPSLSFIDQIIFSYNFDTNIIDYSIHSDEDTMPKHLTCSLRVINFISLYIHFEKKQFKSGKRNSKQIVENKKKLNAYLICEYNWICTIMHAIIQSLDSKKTPFNFKLVDNLERELSLAHLMFYFVAYIRRSCPKELQRINQHFLKKNYKLDNGREQWLSNILDTKFENLNEKENKDTELAALFDLPDVRFLEFIADKNQITQQFKAETFVNYFESGVWIKNNWRRNITKPLQLIFINMVVKDMFKSITAIIAKYVVVQSNLKEIKREPKKKYKRKLECANKRLREIQADWNNCSEHILKFLFGCGNGAFRDILDESIAAITKHLQSIDSKDANLYKPLALPDSAEYIHKESVNGRYDPNLLKPNSAQQPVMDNSFKSVFAISIGFEEFAKGNLYKLFAQDCRAFYEMRFVNSEDGFTRKIDPDSIDYDAAYISYLIYEIINLKNTLKPNFTEISIATRQFIGISVVVFEIMHGTIESPESFISLLFTGLQIQINEEHPY